MSDLFSYPVLIILCLTLGLAPFMPEPHIFEKVRMLLAGNLSKPIDIFDFLMHAAPFALLGAKIVMDLRGA